LPFLERFYGICHVLEVVGGQEKVIFVGGNIGQIASFGKVGLATWSPFTETISLIMSRPCVVLREVTIVERQNVVIYWEAIKLAKYSARPSNLNPSLVGEDGAH